MKTLEEQIAGLKPDGYPDPITERFDLVAPHYSILVEAYMFGQHRIKLCKRMPGEPADYREHGGSVREMCTYKRDVAQLTVSQLAMSPDPEAFCRTLETPYNCEVPGRGRIRLDNTEEDRPTRLRGSGER